MSVVCRFFLKALKRKWESVGVSPFFFFFDLRLLLLKSFFSHKKKEKKHPLSYLLIVHKICFLEFRLLPKIAANAPHICIWNKPSQINTVLFFSKFYTMYKTFITAKFFLSIKHCQVFWLTTKASHKKVLILCSLVNIGKKAELFKVHLPHPFSNT